MTEQSLQERFPWGSTVLWTYDDRECQVCGWMGDRVLIGIKLPNDSLWSGTPWKTKAMDLTLIPDPQFEGTSMARVMCSSRGTPFMGATYPLVDDRLPTEGQAGWIVFSDGQAEWMDIE